MLSNERSAPARRVMLLLAVTLPWLAIHSMAATTPKVESPHGSFKEPCALCHDPRGWKPARVSDKFDHAKYGFALTGAHATGDCMTCHQSLEFKQPRFLCQSCHQDPHRGEMGTACARCHTARSFSDRAPMVRAHQMSAFPLTGSHAALDCEACHKPALQGQMQFVGTRADCQNCHMKDYDTTRNPDHRAGGMPTNCEACHRTLTWNTKTFDHDRTRFPLTGAHRGATCIQCHGDNVYAGKPTACASCHQNDFNSSANPSHAAAGFNNQCQNCHTTVAWDPSNFNHSTATSFALTGAHRNAACNECHGDNVFNGKATACVACHQIDFNNSRTPNHVTSGFPTTCANCHTTTAWTPSNFNHSATAFPLTGAHLSTACSQCHGDNVYAGKPTACDACHHPDYLSASNPNHATAGFSTACQSCHNTTAWSPSTFNHDASWFPIYSGTHSGRWNRCTDCHTVASDFTQFNCLACHPHSDKAQTDGHHNGRSGYSYDSASCYRCHPRGRAG